MLVPNRHGSSDAYRYGFNGKEKDDELKGEGNSYDFGARMLDPRVGRWFAVDPQALRAPQISPYVYVDNDPIRNIDPDGEFLFDVHKRILKNGLKGLGFNYDIMRGMGLNAGEFGGGIVHPDQEGTILNAYFGSYDKHDHYDSMNYKEIKQNSKDIATKTLSLVNKYNTGLLSDKDFGFKIGEVLHAVQDFYSHSNYIELFEQSGGNLKGFIPTYEEVMNGGDKYGKFKTLLNSDKFYSGEYDEDNHKTGPHSHKQVNKDQGAGSKYTDDKTASSTIPDSAGKKPTKYSRAAEKAATRATRQYLQSVKKQIK